jgi:hypothetical protein
MTKSVSKCSFCRYATGSGCMVTPNSHYCREATYEYYRHLKQKQVVQPASKSLRSWDKK